MSRLVAAVRLSAYYGVARRKVTAADIIDRGLVKGCVEQDYLTARFITTPEAIICNQPFALAEAFLTQAICAGCPYIAMTVQLNFLELIGRRWFFDTHPPTRLHISCRRVAMHQHGYTGRRASPNWDWCWYVISRFDRPAPIELVRSKGFLMNPQTVPQPISLQTLISASSSIARFSANNPSFKIMSSFRKAKQPMSSPSYATRLSKNDHI